VGLGKILLEQTDEEACTQRTTAARRDTVPDELAAAWYFTLGNPLRTPGHIRPRDVVAVAMRGCDPGC
jgi:hypothetical protein